MCDKHVFAMAVCLRCGHEWNPRKEHPKKCPGCQNPGWDKPKRRERRSSVTPEALVQAVEALDRLKKTDPAPVEVEQSVDRIAEARKRAEKLLEGLL